MVQPLLIGRPATTAEMDVISTPAVCWGVPRNLCPTFLPEDPPGRPLAPCLVPAPISPTQFYQPPPYWVQPAPPADRTRDRQAFESDPDLGETAVLRSDNGVAYAANSEQFRPSSTPMATATPISAPTQPAMVLMPSQIINGQSTFIPMSVCPTYPGQTFMSPNNYAVWPSNNMMAPAVQARTIQDCSMWGFPRAYTPATYAPPAKSLNVSGPMLSQASAPFMSSYSDRNVTVPGTSQTVSSTTVDESSTATAVLTDSLLGTAIDKQLFGTYDQCVPTKDKNNDGETLVTIALKKEKNDQPQVETLMPPSSPENLRKVVSDTIAVPCTRRPAHFNLHGSASPKTLPSAVKRNVQVTGRQSPVQTGQKKGVPDHVCRVLSTAHTSLPKEDRRGSFCKTPKSRSPRCATNRSMAHVSQASDQSSSSSRVKDPKTVVETAIRFLKSEELHTAVTRWMQIARQRYPSVDKGAVKKQEGTNSSEVTPWSSAASSSTTVASPSTEGNPHLDSEQSQASASMSQQSVMPQASRQSTGTDTRHFERLLKHYWLRMDPRAEYRDAPECYMTMSAEPRLLESGRAHSQLRVPDAASPGAKVVRFQERPPSGRKRTRHQKRQHSRRCTSSLAGRSSAIPLLSVPRHKRRSDLYKSCHLPVSGSGTNAHHCLSFGDSVLGLAKEPDTSKPHFEWPKWMRPGPNDPPRRPPKRLPGNGSIYELSGGQPRELKVKSITAVNKLPTRVSTNIAFLEASQCPKGRISLQLLSTIARGRTA